MLFVFLVVAVLHQLYRAVVDQKQPRHPFDVVLGGKLPGAVLEHVVGDVLLALGCVAYVDGGEGDPFFRVLAGHLLELRAGFGGVLVEDAPEGEHVNALIGELEALAVLAYRPEVGCRFARVRGRLGEREAARPGLGRAIDPVPRGGREHEERDDEETLHGLEGRGTVRMAPILTFYGDLVPVSRRREPAPGVARREGVSLAPRGYGIQHREPSKGDPGERGGV